MIGSTVAQTRLPTSRGPPKMTTVDRTRTAAERQRVVDAAQARKVAEEARESRWDRPSFGKELFLGRFQLDLIHPHPRADVEAVRRGEEFLTRLREVCEQIDGQRIEREALIPDETIKALTEVGALGMKIPTEYGGGRAPLVYYNPALQIIGSRRPPAAAPQSA